MLSTPGVNLARENQKGACATTIFSSISIYLPRATTIYRLGGAHVYSKGARARLVSDVFTCLGDVLQGSGRSLLVGRGGVCS